MSLFLKPILGDQALGTSEVFMVHVSQKISLNDVLEWLLESCYYS